MASSLDEQDSLASSSERHEERHHKKRKHRKKHKKRKHDKEEDRHHKKHKKRKKHDDDADADEVARRQKRKHHHDNEEDGDEGDNKSFSSGGSISSRSSSNRSSEHVKRKKKKSSKKRKRKKKSRYDNNNNNKSSKNDDFSDDNENQSNVTPLSTKYSQVVTQLHVLLSNYPDLATELPYLLIRMCSGSNISTSQISNPILSSKLNALFYSLGCTMVNDGGDEFTFDDGGRWKRTGSSDNNNNERALVLIKLVRFMLNDHGMTMDTIQQFESRKNSSSIGSSVDNNHNITEAAVATTTTRTRYDKKKQHQDNETSSLVTMLLDTFSSSKNDHDDHQQTNESSPPTPPSASLAQELQSIMQMIFDGEIICLDGLEDESLKLSIEKLFEIIGLVKEEMDEDEEEEEEEEAVDTTTEESNGPSSKEVSYGYTLPPPSTTNDTNGDGNDQDEKSNGLFHRIIKEKLLSSIEATVNYHRDQILKLEKSSRKVVGPVLPTNPAAYNPENYKYALPVDESDEDDGPAPLGSHMAKARSMKAKSHHNLNKPNNTENSATDGETETKREEWMMTPGEHNFLKGVMSSGVIKSRKFKNEKNRGQAVVSSSSAPPEVPMNPMVQQKIDSIMDAHKAARGPSLVEQHRQRVAEEKAAKKAAAAGGKNGSDWNWSKDDLDSGRRVDKNYLHMVMGGASKELKNKFQGSFSTGFS